MENPSNPYSSASAAPAFDDPFKEPAAPAAEPAAKPADGAPDGGEPTPEPEPEWASEAPEEYKAISGQANIKAEYKKWLRDTFGELHEFKSTPYGTKEAFQELLERFPGGIEDLRGVHEGFQELQRVQRMLESGDPDQMNEAIEERLVGSPDLFIAETQGRLDALKRSNLTQEYDGIARVLAKERLDAASEGGFEKFYDGLSALKERYFALDPNSDEAKKLAGQLAASALELAGWWGGAKQKLGYGQQPEAKPATGIRGPAVVRPGAADQREVQAANRDVQSFNGRLADSHNQAINPLISSAIKKEIALQKVSVPERRMARILKDVNQDILNNLARDPQFQSLINREHYKGNREDVRGYDTSDKIMRQLVDAAKRRAEKLIPKLVQGYVSELGVPTSAAAPDPARNVSGGAAPSGKQDKRSRQDILSDKKVNLSDTLDAVLN